MRSKRPKGSNASTFARSVAASKRRKRQYYESGKKLEATLKEINAIVQRDIMPGIVISCLKRSPFLDYLQNGFRRRVKALYDLARQHGYPAVRPYKEYE